MTSEIRVNKINNRAGLGTITIADTGVVVNGIVTCTEVSGLNVLNIAGVSTFASTLDINGDIDVDGHTNLDNVSISGVVTATTYKGDGSQLTGIAVGGASSITFNDNVGLYFGAGNSNGRDLEIIHEPSNSVTSFKLEANDAQFSKINGNKIARFSTTGTSYLYYNNNLRLETTSSGITLPTTVLISSNNRLNFRDGNAYILHESSTLKIQTAGAGGDIRLRTNSSGGSDGDIIFNGGSIGEILRAHGAGHIDVTNSLNVGAGVSVVGIVTAANFLKADGSAVGGLASDSSRNTLGGTNAGDSITSATDCTFLGKDAGTDITDGNFNTFIGSLAGSNTNSGTYLNTFVGYSAGVNNGNGNHNVFIGANTGTNNEAWDNIFIGNYSGEDNTSGTRNVFVGKYSGSANTTANDNIAIGNKAAFLLRTGARNVIMGTEAAYTGPFNDDSVIIGYKAGYNLTDDRNVLIGFEAGHQANDAQNNVLVGYRAGRDVTTGDYNVIIGDDAGNAGTNDLTTGRYNIIIGHQASASSATVSNEITFGDSDINHLRIPGIGVSFSAGGAVIAGVCTATSFSGDGSNLSNLPASAPVGGASTNTVFFENDVAVAVNYQITSNKNAMSAGPIAINAGIAVTVPSGSSWTIV